jgi:hypothetical protein
MRGIFYQKRYKVTEHLFRHGNVLGEHGEETEKASNIVFVLAAILVEGICDKAILHTHHLVSPLSLTQHFPVVLPQQLQGRWQNEVRTFCRATTP